jgi:hypothetical protein
MDEIRILYNLFFSRSFKFVPNYCPDPIILNATSTRLNVGALFRFHKDATPPGLGRGVIIPFPQKCNLSEVSIPVLRITSLKYIYLTSG